MSDVARLQIDPRELTIAEQANQIAELSKLVAEITQENQQLREENKQLKERIERLEALLATKLNVKSSKKPVFTENYSLERNKLLDPNKLGNKDSDKKPRKKSTGRKPREAKEHLVSDTIAVFPEGVDRDKCIHHRFQSAWRIVDGKAVYLRYDIRDLPGSTSLPLPLGIRNSRSEFGMEVILILSFLHYWVGVSQVNAIGIMNFFTGIDLSRSQADSLLNQLADDWRDQHDAIAELIALQMVVYIDETGWKVGTKACYTWIFSTAKHVLFRCGVSRKKTEATSVPGDLFNGIGVTDDYAAYKSLFTEHQLCWSHLIRKAIKLVLQNHLLQQELVDNVDCLFVFVEHPEVEPTNNRSERNARREAEIRKGARTNKTDSGADRRSVIVTVLASLQTRNAKFTLSNMLAEVGRWVDAGKSLFEMELDAIQAKRAPPI